MNIKWDAQTYTDHFSFVHEYGEDVIKLIEQHDALSVLDLGCGNGALTKKISDLGMNVIGMDASEELLKVARENYPDLTFIKGDATNFELAENVDVVFSNAVFHWIHQEKQMQMKNGIIACHFIFFSSLHTSYKRLQDVNKIPILPANHINNIPNIPSYNKRKRLEEIWRHTQVAILIASIAKVPTKFEFV